MISNALAAALARRNIHYGWVVAFTTFLVMLATAGAMGSAGVLIQPLEKEFGWSTEQISSASSEQISSLKQQLEEARSLAAGAAASAEASKKAASALGPMFQSPQRDPRELMLGGVSEQAAQHLEVGVAEAFCGVEVGGVDDHVSEDSGAQARGDHPPRHHLLRAGALGAEVQVLLG